MALNQYARQNPAAALRPAGTDVPGAMMYAPGSKTFSQVLITRPANTTAYAAGDVIGIADAGTPANAGSAIIEFKNVGLPGSVVVLNDLKLYFNDAAPGPTGTFGLHLFTSAPAAVLDNAAMPAITELTSYRTSVTSAAAADIGGFQTAIYTGGAIPIPLVTSSLFALIVTTAGYTPASGSTIRAELICSQY